jgi:Cu(I)/Ag(I) efflux system periplasmic protein CusF
MKQHTEMKMKVLQGFAFFVMIALVPAIAIAQSASGISAKVEKVDESANKVTLDHAAIPGLDMPAMTMVYKVQDSKMLKSVKTGDKVKFNIERINGQLTVTKIDKAK